MDRYLNPSVIKFKRLISNTKYATEQTWMLLNITQSKSYDNWREVQPKRSKGTICTDEREKSPHCQRKAFIGIECALLCLSAHSSAPESSLVWVDRCALPCTRSCVQVTVVWSFVQEKHWVPLDDDDDEDDNEMAYLYELCGMCCAPTSPNAFN